jgi:hypothetical protein
MKKILLELWRFISDVRFALLLIFLTILAVSLATFYESRTQSHHEAMSFYRHPLFMTLLAGYFVNILTSAIRRWPFQRHHIGFLTTHLGLLMILLGQMLKIETGLQGHLLLKEGSEKNTYIDSEKVVIKLFKDSPQSKDSLQWTLDMAWGKWDTKKVASFFQNTSLKASLHPTSVAKKELYHFWTGASKSQLCLNKPLSDPLLVSLPRYFFVGETQQPQLLKTIQDSLKITFGNQLLEIGQKQNTSLGDIEICLQQYEGDFLPYAIECNIFSALSSTPEIWSYSLEYNSLPAWKCLTHPLKTHLDIEIKASPFLALYQTQIDPFENTSQVFSGLESLIYLNEEGRWQRYFYSAGASTKLLILPEGYGALAEFMPSNPIQLEEKLPYLELSTSSQEALIALYPYWQKAGTVGLLDPPSILPSNLGLDWNQLSKEQQTCLWLLHHLTQNVDWSDPHGLFMHLKERFWPLAHEIEITSSKHIHPNIEGLARLLLQIKSLAPLVQAQVMPMLEQEGPFFEQHPLYTQTLWLTLEGFHPCHLFLEPSSPQKPLVLVSQVDRQYVASQTQEPDKELRTLQVDLDVDGNLESIEIPLEKLDKGLAWPIFGGQWWIKASHPTYPLGYTLRLHRTFAHFYPGSLTPQNYHAEMSWQAEDATPHYVDVSMNKVLELPHGYRLYLSSISPLQPTAARTALFVISHDPFKNILTYPGALLVSLGSLILLIRKRAYVQQLFR